MALFCQFEDLNHMRGEISRLWIDYRNHERVLVSISLATKTAHEMAETPESALHERYANLNSAHAIMSALIRTVIDTDFTVFGCKILHMEEHYNLPKLFMNRALCTLVGLARRQSGCAAEMYGSFLPWS